MNIDETLKERGANYGVFTEHARITQNIKRAMKDSPKWHLLADDQQEALEMAAHKIGRILNGDPNFHDSWHDIIGYIRLVETRLEPRQEEPPLQATRVARDETQPGSYGRLFLCAQCGCIHDGECQIGTRMAKVEKQAGWNVPPHHKDCGI